MIAGICTFSFDNSENGYWRRIFGLWRVNLETALTLNSLRLFLTGCYSDPLWVCSQRRLGLMEGQGDMLIAICEMLIDVIV